MECEEEEVSFTDHLVTNACDHIGRNLKPCKTVGKLLGRCLSVRSFSLEVIGSQTRIPDG